MTASPGTGTGNLTAWIPPRLRLCVLGLLAATLVSGCVLRVAYNQLDWLAMWYIEGYVSLDSSQKEQAREMIGRNIVWHRTTQLPRYAALLEDLRDGIGQPLTTGDIAARYDEVVDLWDAFLLHVAPDAAALLLTLSDEQVESLFERLERQNGELAQEYSGNTATMRRARQDKAVIRAFRRFTGRLTTGQVALIGSHTANFEDTSTEWLNRRAAWQAEFGQLLAARNSDPAFLANLTGLLLDPNQFDSPSYRRQVEYNQQEAFKLVAEVMNSLNARQQAHLQGKLDTYIEDLTVLLRGA